MTSTILQIMPCPVDICAKYKSVDDRYYKTLLVCFALVETELDGKRWRNVIGMELRGGRIELVPECYEFDGYELE